MEATAGFKPLGGLTVIILFAGLSFLVRRWPQTNHMTFSQHAAAYRRTILYYCALFTITLPLALLFFIRWFAPTFHLYQLFVDFIIISCVTQYICTLIPEVGKQKARIHQAFAGISAIALVPPLFMLLSSNYVYGPAKLVILICLIVMVIILGLVGINKQKYLGWKLQAWYFAAFFFAILTLTY